MKKDQERSPDQDTSLGVAEAGRRSRTDVPYRAIVESAIDFAIIATDRDGRVTHWNTGAERVMGWSAQEMRGEPIERVFTPEDRAIGRAATEMRHALEEGHAGDERWHIRKDDGRFWASGEMMPLRNKGGNHLGFVKILRDRTPQHTFGSALRAAADRHAALAATQRAVDVAGGDLAGVMQAVVEGALAAAPASDGAVIEMREGEDIVYRAAAGTSAAHVGLRLKMTSSFSGLCISQGRPLVCADSETDTRVDREACRRIGVGSMVVIPVPHHGQFVGVLKLHAHRAGALGEADVPTAQLLVGAMSAGLAGYAEAEAIGALRASEERLRIAQEAGGVGVFEWNLAAGTVTMSPMFRRLWGVSDSVLPLSTLGALIVPEDRPRVGSLHPDAGVEALAYTEYRIRRPDNGDVRWIARRGEVLSDAQGRPTRGFGVAYDITDQKAREAALADLNRTLETRVTDGVSQRLQIEEQLRQAQKMEAVGQLTGGIAHDFNNLLAGIVGSLDLMQTRMRQGRIADLERYATAAMTSASRAAALTHRLLAFARRQPLAPKPTDVNALLGGMEDLLRRTLTERIRLEVLTAAGVWSALCDPHQLESAVLNLAINARDAMPNGGRLMVGAANVHLDGMDAAPYADVASGQYVCISVTDSGTGMTPDVIARAFEPFFTTKPFGQGTGLGLSMIYGFVRQSHGHVRIASEVGQGTSVKLYLPRSQEELAGGEVAVAPLASRLARPGETVLVVEDEPVIRALIVDVLNELGYATLEAEDGLAGLGLAQSATRVDLMITDVGLPGIDGRNLADKARALRPDLKVLYVTGYAQNSATDLSFTKPGTALITKPFAVETLTVQIQSLLPR